MTAAPPAPGFLDDVWLQILALLAVISGLFTIADHWRAPAAPPLSASAPLAARAAAAAPTAKDGPLTVDPRGGADARFTAIGAAVQAAKDGDTILLKPGVYNESVSVSKSLVFSGLGSADQVQWTSASPRTITVSAGRVFFKSLTIFNTGGADAAAVETAGATASFEQARVHAVGTAALVKDGGLEATDTDFQARNAVTIYGKSRGSLLRSTVTGGWTGLWVEGMSEVRVESTELKGVQNSGVEAGRFAKLRLIEVSLVGSGQAAVQARTGADVRIERSRVADNRGCGVNVEGASLSVERVRFERERCGVGFLGPGSLEAVASEFQSLELGPLAIKPGNEKDVVLKGSGNTGLTIPAK